MRKITRLAVDSFLNFENFTMDNTEVIHNGSLVSEMKLHGNTIAVMNNYGNGHPIFTLSDCGWKTNTTAERLEGILSVISTDIHYSKSCGFFKFVERKSKRDANKTVVDREVIDPNTVTIEL